MILHLKSIINGPCYLQNIRQWRLLLAIRWEGFDRGEPSWPPKLVGDSEVGNIFKLEAFDVVDLVNNITNFPPTHLVTIINIRHRHQYNPS